MEISNPQNFPMSGLTKTDRFMPFDALELDKFLLGQVQFLFDGFGLLDYLSLGRVPEVHIFFSDLGLLEMSE